MPARRGPAQNCVREVGRINDASYTRRCSDKLKWTLGANSKGFYSGSNRSAAGARGWQAGCRELFARMYTKPERDICRTADVPTVFMYDRIMDAIQRDTFRAGGYYTVASFVDFY